MAAPLLLAALVTGLIVSLLQAATQINEQTLSFIPKILAVVATIALALRGLGQDREQAFATARGYWGARNQSNN